MGQEGGEKELAAAAGAEGEEEEEGADGGITGKRRARSATPLLPPHSKKPRAALSGKRAYLEAVPHVVSLGPRRTPARLLPEGVAIKVGAAAAGRKRAAVAAEETAAEALEAAALAAPLFPPLTSVALPLPSATAAVAASAVVAPMAPGGVPAAPATKIISTRARLAAARLLEPSAVAFGKSGVAGWGAFARRRFAPGAMVMEYRGEEIRAGAVATAREASYRAAGDDCYLFARDAGTLVDTTRRGSVARFTNHSCSPSLYTRVFPADEKAQTGPRIVFLARSEIKPGQELTYDYRFAEEEGEANKVDCACGAPACRGTLN